MTSQIQSQPNSIPNFPVAHNTPIDHGQILTALQLIIMLLVNNSSSPVVPYIIPPFINGMVQNNSQPVPGNQASQAQNFNPLQSYAPMSAYASPDNPYQVCGFMHKLIQAEGDPTLRLDKAGTIEALIQEVKSDHAHHNQQANKLKTIIERNAPPAPAPRPAPAVTPEPAPKSLFYRFLSKIKGLFRNSEE